MKLAKVYRVEHKETAHGPYYTSFYGGGMTKSQHCELEELVSSHLTHPTLHPEPNVFFDREQHFGFPSIKQLAKWFHDVAVRKKLKKLGFVVSIYETSQKLSINKQCVFERSTATLVKQISLMSSLIDG